VLELQALAARRGARLVPVGDDDSWAWKLEVVGPGKTTSVAQALVTEASALSGAVVDVVCGHDPEALVAAARIQHQQQGRWALRREAGGSRYGFGGGHGHQSITGLAAALGAALGGVPSANGVAETELAFLLIESRQGTCFFLGRWVPADAQVRWMVLLGALQDRPFHFSSGLDFRLCQVAVTLALVDHMAKSSKTLFLDPCCGSGTSLVCALIARSCVPDAIAAFDVNPKHLLGSMQNLRHAGLAQGKAAHLWARAEAFAERLCQQQGQIEKKVPASSTTVVEWVEVDMNVDTGSIWFHAGLRDASDGISLDLPQVLAKSGWHIVGVANLAWGRKQATTPKLTSNFLRGLRETCRNFSSGSVRGCRFCCILGPEVDVSEVLASTGWKAVQEPIAVQRSNCTGRILCSVVVVEPA